MKSTYDKIADALYITFKRGKVSHTVQLSEKMNADMDKSGNILGVEVLNASSQFDVKSLTKSPSIPLSVVNS